MLLIAAAAAAAVWKRFTSLKFTELQPPLKEARILTGKKQERGREEKEVNWSSEL